MIELTKARLDELLVYDSDTGLFTRRVSHGSAKAGKATGCLHKKGYIFISVDDRAYSAHRLAWLHAHGSWPSGQIDHINGNRSDNRICNLRDVSAGMNQQNRRVRSRNSTSGFLGVSKARHRWRAAIQAPDGRRVNLGSFDSPEQAHAAYLEAKRAIHPGGTI